MVSRSNPLRRLISMNSSLSGSSSNLDTSSKSTFSISSEKKNKNNNSSKKLQKSNSKKIASPPSRALPVEEWDCLLIAAQKNQSDRIHVLLTKLCVDPNHTNAVGQTALHIAALWGNLDSVKTLLECGADPNSINQLGGSTPLHMLCQSTKASEEELLKVADTLLQHGAETMIADAQGKIPHDYMEGSKNVKLAKKLTPRPPAVFAAIEEMNVKELYHQLEQYVDSSDTSSSASTVSSSSSSEHYNAQAANQMHRGKTPLVVAVEMLLNEQDEHKLKKIVRMIELLLQKGADPHFAAVDEFGLQEEQMLSQLLETLRRKMQKQNSSPAIKSLQAAICAFLNARAAFGQKLDSFLHQAARFDQVNFCEFLLERVAPLAQQAARDAVNKSDYNLDDSLDRSVMNDETTAAACGLDVNVRGRQGLTALHFCARSGKVDMLNYLLSHPDIDVDVQDDRGMTPLEAAHVNNKDDIIQALEEYAERRAVLVLL